MIIYSLTAAGRQKVLMILYIVVVTCILYSVSLSLQSLVLVICYDTVFGKFSKIIFLIVM